MRFDISTKKKPQSLVFAHIEEYLETDCEEMSNVARFGNDVMCALYVSSKIYHKVGKSSLWPTLSHPSLPNAALSLINTSFECMWVSVQEKNQTTVPIDNSEQSTHKANQFIHSFNLATLFLTARFFFVSNSKIRHKMQIEEANNHWAFIKISSGGKSEDRAEGRRKS